MTEHDKKTAGPILAEFIKDNQHLIIEEWRSAAAADSSLVASKSMTRDHFVDHIPDALEAFCQALNVSDDSEQAHLIRQNVLPHGHHRWKQGYDLEELLRDWGLLSRVLASSYAEHHMKQWAHTREPVSLSCCTEVILHLLNEAMCFSVQEYERMRKAEARSLQADLEEAQQQFQSILQARGEMLREAAHDLRGSLSGVSNASQVMQRLGGSDDHNREKAQRLLEHSILSVNSLLEDLLDLSRLEANCQEKNLQEIDVADLIRESVDGLQANAEQAGLELRLEGSQSLRATTDPTALRRILQNLVLNGIRYTEEGFVLVRYAECDDENWKLTIEDTGPGMQHLEGTPIAREMDKPLQDSRRPPAHEDEAQEVYQGEGIGLTIVKRLCELLHASIRYNSEPGKGAVFVLEFPRQYPE